MGNLLLAGAGVKGSVPFFFTFMITAVRLSALPYPVDWESVSLKVVPLGSVPFFFFLYQC
jgi:hypothetical protein